MLALQKDNSMQLMMRPPKEADRKDWGNQATQTRQAPIILDAGTSSYLDNHKIVENVRANRLGKKSVISSSRLNLALTYKRLRLNKQH